MLDVRMVTFNEDGSTVFEFADVPGDMRESGMMKATFLMVPPMVLRTADAMAELRDAAQRALATAKAEYDSEVPSQLELDDDLPGYDNPDEREDVR